MQGIYKIQNKVNGKIYIGQSKNIERRWNEHRKVASRRKSQQKDYPLYQDMGKYSIDKFEFSIIEDCQDLPSDIMTQRESYWIHYYNSINQGYNQTDPLKWMPGDKAWNKLTKEDVLKIIELLQNSQHTQTEIARIFNVADSVISNINTGETYKQENVNYPIREVQRVKPAYCSNCGKPISIGTKHGMCIQCLGLTQLRLSITKEELKEDLKFYQGNLAAISRKYNVGDHTIKKYCKRFGLLDYAKEQKPKPKIKQESPPPKPVYQINPNTNEIIARFESTREAERAVPDAYSHIAAVCKGHRQTAGGYKWKYVNDDSNIV